MSTTVPAVPGVPAAGHVVLGSGAWHPGPADTCQKCRPADPARPGDAQLLASVHIDGHGRVTRRPPATSPEGGVAVVGYVDRYRGNRTPAQRRGGPWRWVLEGGQSSPVCYPTRRAALLAMLRNPNVR